ncbi:FecR domain-containing protein [Novosphingobium tardum]|uniref:FecR domain-containing protein n=1 Tax=Novosphingobium tardum TaxID=1538021 RepID=A0ABV8RSK2_9SPHN
MPHEVAFGGEIVRNLIIVPALVLLFTAAPAWAEIGRIKSHVGEVLVVRKGAAVAAAPGLKLEQGDIVKTGKDGRVGIAFLDNTRMALGPSSRITLDEFSYDRSRQTGSFVTSVNRGSLGVVSGNIAKSKRDAMRVRTPTSMLGVRGTKFVVEVKGRGSDK